MLTSHHRHKNHPSGPCDLAKTFALKAMMRKEMLGVPKMMMSHIAQWASEGINAWLDSGDLLGSEMWLLGSFHGWGCIRDIYGNVVWLKKMMIGKVGKFVKKKQRDFFAADGFFVAGITRITSRILHRTKITRTMTSIQSYL